MQKENSIEENKYHALALFSGGLDSILAIKTIENQGLKVKCLHFVSPFFGSVEKIAHWSKVYSIDIDPVDIGDEYSSLLKNSPVYGYGSTLNPCVDCKILMMRKAKTLLDHYGASFIISGEVLGQRPMSQRRDTLNVIHRDAGLKDILLRPLCAKHMTPTEAEISGLVNRDLLHNFSGRGRNSQLTLAKEFGIKEIPTPAGGCKLTEKDTSARYFSVLQHHNANKENFDLANTGRQFWHEDEKVWFVIGRNQEDNLKLESIAQDNDILIRVDNFPSPLGLIRPILHNVSNYIIDEASALLASYSPKALAYSQSNQVDCVDENCPPPLEVSVIIKKINMLKNDTNHNIFENSSENLDFSTKENHIKIKPKRESLFKEPQWEEAKMALKQLKSSG